MARRLVIIGGDAAGMSAAAQARRMTSAGELEIVAFERSSRTSYAACGLPYLVGGFVDSPDSLIARTPEQHRAKGIDVRTRHEVTAIDATAFTVSVRGLESGQDSAGHYDAHYRYAMEARRRRAAVHAGRWGNLAANTAACSVSSRSP